MIDQTVSHYRILEKLGEGGMGEVFLAEDTSLSRKVALKFLPEHLRDDELARRRFLREAESAAALEHPYICNIKEVGHAEDGRDFIVMEFVKGQTLKERLEQGPLSLEETLQISAEVADALELAHKKGIVHRDLKPANIMLTPQGHAKVMDFGLAKRVVTEDGTEQDLTTGLTGGGSTLGTPAYMSPEQVRALPVDHRSDLFSLGIIFYEMLTGLHPFRRHGPVETMGAILHEDPEPLARHLPNTSELLQKTVSRLLAKDPAGRMKTVGEFSDRLTKLSARQEELRLTAFLRSRLGRRLALAMAAVVGIVLIGWWIFQGGHGDGGPVVSSLAVLPLANLSGDPEQEYFADGMTEALITDLSKIGALKVISRSSAMRYKNTDKSLSEIARELDVEAVIEGSVLREEDQVRITAQLIEAATERNLWADRYERNLTSILALQGEVAQAIAREIRVTLTPVEESLLTSRRQVNPEAYEAYLKGQSHWYKLTPADLETAHEYFQQALGKDPDYALAHVGVALYWIGLQQMGVVPPGMSASKARAAVQRALELDETLPETHYAMALLRTWTDWDWEGGEASFKRALELNPNYADGRAYYSHYLIVVGCSNEAMAEMGRALELDPLNPLFRALYSAVLLGARRADDAIEQARIALKNVPNHPVAYACLLSAFHAKGMPEETYQTYRAFNAAMENPEGVRVLEQGYADGGVRLAMKRMAEWLAESPGSFPVTPFDVALAYNYAGENEKVLEWLERGVEERDSNMPYFAMWPGFDDFHADPRYQELLKQMNHPRLAQMAD